MNVLLVDDDVFLRDMYETKFSQENANVTIANNGNEAVKLLQDNHFDVVVSDMIMPGLSGLELLKHLRTNMPETDTKFVILSNQSEEKDRQAVNKYGVDGYIVKAEKIPSEVVAEVFNIVNN